MSRHHKASILIVAIWVLATLSVFAVYLGNIIRQRILIAARVQDNQSLHLIADAGVKQALSVFGINSGTFGSLDPKCFNNPESFKDVAVGRGRFSVSFTYRDWQTGLIETRYGLIDEESKININSASKDVLMRLLQNICGLDTNAGKKLADAFIDYRDSDTVTIEGIEEGVYYSEQGKPYKCKDDFFEVVEELKLIKGVTAEIFEKIKGYITVYGSGLVNINTATGVVLEALGLSRPTVEKIIAYRSGKDQIEGTLDDNLVDTITEQYPDLVSSVSPLTIPEKSEFMHLVALEQLSAASSCIMISVNGSLNTGGKMINVTSVYETGKIRYFKEKLLAS